MTTLAERPRTTPSAAPVAEPRRPRQSVWPYAGLLTAVAGGASTFFLAVGKGAYDAANDSKADNIEASTVLDNLSNHTNQMIGGGLAVVAGLAALVFVIGLARFAGHFAAGRHTLLTALRWSGAALFGTTAIGASFRYIAAGGHPDGIDHKFYTEDAVSTLSILADQVAFAGYLPALVVMGVTGILSLRDRVFPRAVGAVAVVLAAGSTAATLVLGLPYSSGLVFPLFALLIGIAAVASRKAH